MDNNMHITIRKFTNQDIPNKVTWINDPENNRYLHYDLPLNEEKTREWFKANKDREDRYDAVIEANTVPIGLIGLLSIDKKNGKAEYYVTIGNRDYLGKGAAAKASKILLEYAFRELGLNRVYLYTESENISAIRLYERVGFKREGLIRKDVFSKGRFVDRYIYGITKADFYSSINTPIYFLDTVESNSIYVKREDMLPFSFGGNKARKAKLFFEEIDKGNYNCVVTYGSGSSNHCRVVSNMAAVRGMKCYIISPEETFQKTYNSKLMNAFEAEMTVCPVDKVHDTIENKLRSLSDEGQRPYFIAGGGHGNIGTRAYLDCYEEIRQYERDNHIYFDYIIHASGTGTTQAGLVVGQLINCEERKIVGISIARTNPRGRNVILESVKDFFSENRINVPIEKIEKATIFIDDYVNDGYGKAGKEVEWTIKNCMIKYGLPLDKTYTGKAFTGMLDYIKKEHLKNKKILFVHTGGTPLFFDSLEG